MASAAGSACARRTAFRECHHCPTPICGAGALTSRATNAACFICSSLGNFGPNPNHARPRGQMYEADRRRLCEDAHATPSVQNCWCAWAHVPLVRLQSGTGHARWRWRPGSPRGIPLEHGICRRKCVSISVYIYVVPRPAAEHRSIDHPWIMMNRRSIMSG